MQIFRFQTEEHKFNNQQFHRTLQHNEKNKRHIPEDVYGRLGSIKDTDYDGEAVEKPDGISQEIRHRAKILSHQL